LEPAEDKRIKSDGFYEFVQHKLIKDDTLKKYPRRVECIMETLKKKKAIDDISTDDMKENFEIVKITNSTVTIVFMNADELLNDIMSKVEDANFGCLMPGLVSVIILASILLGLISCVICTNKNNPLPSQA